MRGGCRVPFIPQMETVECGAACLAMVLARFGRHVPLAEVRQACSVSRNGASAAAMLNAAFVHGLDGAAYQAEVEELPSLPLPLILHWEFNHFVVLEKLTPEKAVLMDPSLGRTSVRMAAFRSSYTGVAISLQPTQQFRKRAARRPSLARYRALAKACLPNLALVLLASLSLQMVGLVLPLGQKILVDRVIAPHQEGWLWGLAAALVGAVLAQALLSFCRGWVIQNLQAAINLALVKGFVNHLLRLPIGFFLQRRSGDLIQRIDSNTAIQNLFTERSVAALLDTLLLAGYGALMIAFNVRLGLIVVGLGVIQAACQWATREANARTISAELATGGAANATLTEALSALENIKAAGAEGIFVRRWTASRVASGNSELRRHRLALKLEALLGALQHLGGTLVFLAAGWEVLEQRMTIGTFSAFVMLQGLFFSPLASLLEAYGQLQQLGSHLNRLDDVLETDPEPSGSKDPGRLLGCVSLADVSFAFPGCKEQVLSGIDVEIHAGQKVAIVGPTGAGKSTLARLLLGMHLPDRGSIRFDGLDLRDLDLSRLRRQMGVVLQETFLLNDSIRANLRLYAPDLPNNQIEEAARSACLHDFVRTLPEGYGTCIGENGSILSGGQRQRLALARALAAHPAILLLDEATSALDEATEAQVHLNLARFGCTRILIAHRLATVKDADLILVLDQGRIIQRGAYQDLIDKPGLFRALAGGGHDSSP